MDICKTITLVASVIALVLGILIFVKMDKHNCNSEPYKGMNVKATNACVGYITMGLGSQDSFPCGDWKYQNDTNNGQCSTDTMGLVSCYGKGSDFGPLDCCSAIDGCDVKNLKRGQTCQDPN